MFPNGFIVEERIGCQVEATSKKKVLEQLGEEFRTPLLLFYFEQFSYREIAEQMDVPIGTVMSRLARAKAWLRDRLSAGVAEMRVGEYAG